MIKPKLGKKVKFKRHLIKIGGSNIWGNAYDMEREYRMWEENELKEYAEGFIAGKRTINYKGYVDLGFDNTDPNIFKSLETKEVYLIACDMRGFYRVPAQ